MTRARAEEYRHLAQACQEIAELSGRGEPNCPARDGGSLAALGGRTSRVAAATASLLLRSPHSLWGIYNFRAILAPSASRESVLAKSRATSNGVNAHARRNLHASDGGDRAGGQRGGQFAVCADRVAGAEGARGHSIRGGAGSKSISVQDRSEGAALKRWREAAKGEIERDINATYS